MAGSAWNPRPAPVRPSSPWQESDWRVASDAGPKVRHDEGKDVVPANRVAAKLPAPRRRNPLGGKALRPQALSFVADDVPHHPPSLS